MLYSSVRSRLKTGDMVLFAGTSFVSRMIQMFTRSKWSHVGLVVKSEWLNLVLLWESTTLSATKTINGVTREGVAVRVLSDVVEDYDGVIGLRQLEHTLEDHEELTISDLRHEFKGRDYEISKLELFRSAYDGIGGKNEEDLSSLFCSELVAEAYQRIGFLSDGVPSNEYTPADLATTPISKGLNFLREIVYLERG